MTQPTDRKIIRTLGRLLDILLEAGEAARELRAKWETALLAGAPGDAVDETRGL